MFIEFDKDYLRELFEEGRTSDKKHRYQPEVIRGYYKCVMLLKRAKNVEQLYQIRSLNYEVLQGNKKGISSVRINLKYRLEFLVHETNDEPIITICRLMEISNHYKWSNMETTKKKIYAPDELICAEAIHPGEMLKDELHARGISQRKFARIIGMPYTAFNEIINGKRPITTDIALKIEAATNIAADLWLGLQADYNMQTARHDNQLSAMLEQIRQAVALI